MIRHTTENHEKTRLTGWKFSMTRIATFQSHIDSFFIVRRPGPGCYAAWIAFYHEGW